MAPKGRGPAPKAEVAPKRRRRDEDEDEDGQQDGDEHGESGSEEGSSGSGTDEGESGSSGTSSSSGDDSGPDVSDEEDDPDEEGEDGGQAYEEVRVAFEFKDPQEIDFLGLKALLTSYLDGQQYDCSGLVDTIIKQVGRSLVPVGEEGGVKTS